MWEIIKCCSLLLLVDCCWLIIVVFFSFFFFITILFFFFFFFFWGRPRNGLMKKQLIKRIYINTSNYTNCILGVGSKV